MKIEFKSEGGIYIKPKNRGSFRRWCGGNVTDECIRRGKNSPNPKIRKKATFADNARHFKHKLGGILKGQNGLISPEINVDLTPANLKQLYDRYKAYGNGRYIDTLLLRNVDNELIKHNVGYPLRMAVLVTTQLEGNRTGSHGNGARGLVGWRSGRAANLPSTVEGQVKKLHNETYGEFNGNNWNDGGKGSGYMSGRDALKAFKNAKTISEAVRAFNYGYVRPPASDTRYRINLSKKLFKKGGKAFVPGVSITDSNPKMYKYLKKKIKMNQYGGFIPKELDNSAYIQSSYMDVPFVMYGRTGNDYLDWKQKQDLIKQQRELLKQSDDFQRWFGIGEQLLNLGIGYLSNKGSNTGNVSTPTYFNTPKLLTSLQTSFKPNYNNVLSVPSLTPPTVSNLIKY